MITIKGPTAEVVAATNLIKAQAAMNKSKIMDLVEMTGGGVTVMTLTILSEAEYNAERRDEALNVPGRFVGTIKKWNRSGWGYIAQPDDGKDIFLGDAEIIGKGYFAQVGTGTKVSYRRDTDPKENMRAVDVCMIDNPASVEAFLSDAKSHERRENRRIKDRARRPAPKPYTPKEPYKRAAKDEGAFKGEVVFRPDSK